MLNRLWGVLKDEGYINEDLTIASVGFLFQGSKSIHSLPIFVSFQGLWISLCVIFVQKFLNYLLKE